MLRTPYRRCNTEPTSPSDKQERRITVSLSNSQRASTPRSPANGTSSTTTTPSLIEISYSSTLLFMWALLLAVISYQAGFTAQAASIMVLSTVALISEHGESRMLMPLVFLSERCLDHVMNLGHSPSEFYASTLLSYLTLVACKAERKGKSARDRHVVAETLLYAVVGLCVVYFIVRDKVISFGAVAYVGVGYVFFLKLLPVLGDNEAVLVSSIVGFYICDLCMNNNLSIDGGLETILNLNAPGYETSYTHIASRGMFLCAIYLVASVSVLSRFCLVPVNRNSKSSDLCMSRKRITIVFWVSLAIISIVLAVVISYQFQENVFAWLYAYTVSSRFRLGMIILWVTFIPVAVIIVDLFTRTIRPAVRRKTFHFIAVIAFTPAAMIDPPFLAFAMSAATALCVIAEVARYYKVAGTECLSRFAAKHIDDRDSINGVVRTHLYLMYGFGMSLMLQYRHHKNQLQQPVPAIIELSINIIPGIVSLGIVDACAAIIGSSFLLGSRRALGRYLKNKVFTERANTSITHKTTTGTIGGLICGLIYWCFILAVAEVPLVGPVWYTFTMILVCTVTECFMDGIDNLQMPLVIVGSVSSLFAMLVPAPELWVSEAINRPNPTTAASLAAALTSPWKNWHAYV